MSEAIEYINKDGYVVAACVNLPLCVQAANLDKAKEMMIDMLQYYSDKLQNDLAKNDFEYKQVDDFIGNINS